ncbi:MAG: hypothetical protein RL081_140 [Pseudomonadota bacterium]
MNRNLWLLALCQGLFLTNNVTFIAINGLVGLALAPYGWMATLPVMGYVVGGALSTPLVAKTQSRFGRRGSFQIGLAVAAASALLGAWAVAGQHFWVLVAATVIAGYYSANGQLYRFAAAELALPAFREKAVSLVLAGGLLGAIAGPNLAARTRNLLEVQFAGAYVVLAAVALVAMVLMAFIRFPDTAVPQGKAHGGRSLWTIVRQPVFAVACITAALGYGVMNLLMAATPLAMQQCGLGFDDAALVLEWHVIGMFAPGFFTGHLIKRFGTLPIMGLAVRRGVAPVCTGAIPAGRGLEFPVHRQHHAVDGSLPARGKGPGAGGHQFCRVCGDGLQLTGLGRPGRHPGLDPVEPGFIAPGPAGGSLLAVARMAPAGHPGRLSYWLLAQQSVLELEVGG